MGSGHETSNRRHDTINVTLEISLSPPLSFPPSITSGPAEDPFISKMFNCQMRQARQARNLCSPLEPRGVIFLTRKVAVSDHVCYTTEVAALENTRVF